MILEDAIPMDGVNNLMRRTHVMAVALNGASKPSVRIRREFPECLTFEDFEDVGLVVNDSFVVSVVLCDHSKAHICFPSCTLSSK